MAGPGGRLWVWGARNVTPQAAGLGFCHVHRRFHDSDADGLCGGLILARPGQTVLRLLPPLRAGQDPSFAPLSAAPSSLLVQFRAPHPLGRGAARACSEDHSPAPSKHDCQESGHTSSAVAGGQLTPDPPQPPEAAAPRTRREAPVRSLGPQTRLTCAPQAPSLESQLLSPGAGGGGVLRPAPHTLRPARGRQGPGWRAASQGEHRHHPRPRPSKASAEVASWPTATPPPHPLSLRPPNTAHPNSLTSCPAQHGSCM